MELGCLLPVSIELSRLDGGCWIEKKTLLQNKAKFQRCCSYKFNSTQLKRKAASRPTANTDALDCTDSTENG